MTYSAFERERGRIELLWTMGERVMPNEDKRREGQKQDI